MAVVGEVVAISNEPVKADVVGVALGEELLKPNCWEEFLAGERLCCLKAKSCACCSCWTFFGLGWLMMFIFIAKISAVGDEIFTEEGGTLKDDRLVQNYQGFVAARKSVREGCGALDHDSLEACTADPKCEWIEVKLGRGATKMQCEAKAVCPPPPPRTREAMMSWFMVMYSAEKEGSSVLDDNVMETIAKYENVMLSNANGAQTSDGKESPWTDHCKLSYSGANESRCTSPFSPLQAFSMNNDARQKVEEQVNKGFNFAGPLTCMCSHQQGLCGVCNADGTAKPMAQWPPAIATCLASKFAPRRRLTDDSADMEAGESSSRQLQAENTTDVCNVDTSLGVDNIGAFLGSFCSGKPDCQWTAPGLSLACASTVFSHATDSTYLATGEEKKAIITKLTDGGDPYWTAYRKQCYEVDFDSADSKPRYARLMFFAGGNSDDSEVEKEDFKSSYITGRTGWYQKVSALEQEVEADGTLRVMLFAEPILRSQFLTLFVNDMALSTLSLVMVWLYMWFQLESLFLATCGIFEIIFSLPVACSIWSVFLNQQISFLQALTLYMILGIGADDVFVLYDAWQQSKHQPPHISGSWTSRFAWAYRRAFWAMAVTTSTTCGSFVIGAFSPLPEVRDFCIFAAVVVLVDYLFCITFFASAIVVYEKVFKGAGFCCKGLGISLRARGKCLGPGCCWGCCRATFTNCGTCWKVYPLIEDESQPRAIEKFCEGPLFRFLKGLGGKICVLMWTMLIIAGLIGVATSLRTADAAPPIGRPHIDMTRGLEVLINHFPSYRQPKTFAAWGLDDSETVEEWGATHDDDVPSYSSSGASKLATPEGQVQLLKLCRATDLGETEEVRCATRKCLTQGSPTATRCTRDEDVWQKHGIYMPADGLCLTGRYCFMEEVARYWAASQGSCPGKAEAVCKLDANCLWSVSNNVCYSSKTEDDYTGLSSSQFIGLLASSDYAAYRERRRQVLISHSREYDHALYQEYSAFQLTDDEQRIKFAYIGWNASYAAANSVDQANDWYLRWEDFFGKHSSGLGGFQTSDLYVFMATQNEMVRGAILGICLSLVVAGLVLLIATKNWWIVLLGLLNITAIVAVFLGFVPLAGWSLGEYECIFMIATVGLSVDYTAHLLHAYNHSEGTTRHERAQSTLSEMGISVLNSAVTTLLAAVVLFGCGFHFFFQFGAFIFIIILLSIMMSITFLMPIMCMIGPEGEQGRLLRRTAKQ
eukprot:TRINITY_DN74153_c0_g1_i1.p1 TRINITY_DN74153_c0_g1~~TRINITY_DN74153_c0_g1_i1.p1  ORF type:complete len:1239 (+),score=228.57 TRINITY_DN74153_c0_g1_i1:69-3719(+)